MEDSYQSIFRATANAGISIRAIEEGKINSVLESIAKATESQVHHILSENKKDLEKMDSKDPKYDRLLLNEERIASIVKDIRNVISLPCPVGKVFDKKTLENGLELSKITVPFGVIGIIYEARPNVSFDVFALCFKSGNACILKGGSEAQYSNSAIVEVIRSVLDESNIDPNICTLLSNDRKATESMLRAREYIDLIIPRGGKSLIEYVRDNSKIPVIETGAGVCHTYFHKAGDKEKGKVIITNAKTRKVSACNTLDCFIIDKERIEDLGYLCEDLAKHNVVLYADEIAYAVLHKKYPRKLLFKANNENFGMEYLDYKMAIKTVHNINEAIEHITKYSSKHSEAIISEDRESIRLFERMVDAACIYSNASTAFTDGAQFGLGAEIGISTQKMHARGPMALEEVCSYKWIVNGNGQIR